MVDMITSKDNTPKMASFLCRSLSQKRNTTEKDHLKYEFRRTLSPGFAALQCIAGQEIRVKSRSSKKRSQEIDRQLNEMARQERHVIKILLLGSEEAGKSTIVKQMKIIHNDGFTRDELRSFTPTVRDNLLASMKYVLLGMSILKIRLQQPKNKKFVEMVLTFDQCSDDDYFAVTSKIGFALKNLWNDSGVRMAVAKGFQYELNDSALYFFENMDRICAENYIPTATDVLRARIRTIGVIETQFKVNDLTFRMVDVGGQKSERRKWMQCFDDVRAIIFVAALTGYDMVLKHDLQSNRLIESLHLFADVCANKYFVHTATLLFLNKFDLFREKILYSGRHLRHYLTAFKSPDYDVDSAALFIQRLFERANPNPHKVIYTHFTTATDTGNVQAVFQSVMDIIVRENLRRTTFL